MPLLPWLPLIILSGFWRMAVSRVAFVPARKPATRNLARRPTS
jgi:hypothetical protein